MSNVDDDGEDARRSSPASGPHERHRRVDVRDHLPRLGRGAQRRQTVQGRSTVRRTSDEMMQMVHATGSDAVETIKLVLTPFVADVGVSEEQRGRHGGTQ